MEHTEGFFHAADGTRIYRQSWMVDDPQADLFFIHGYGDHSGRWPHLVERCTAAGFAIHALDYRGHGQAGGRRGYCARFDQFLDDVELVRNHVETLRQGDTLFLLGHSLGGLIALKTAIERPGNAAGVIASSPFLGLKLPVPAVKAAAGKLMSKLLPIVSLPTEITPEDVSRDPAVVAAYGSDPLVHHVANARFFTEVLAAHEATLAGAPRLALPVLILQAGDDRLVDPAASRRFHEAAGSEDKQYKELPGLFHEIFNEPAADREMVFDELLAWLRERL